MNRPHHNKPPGMSQMKLTAESRQVTTIANQESEHNDRPTQQDVIEVDPALFGNHNQ
jgi:hypothetical protein